MVERRRAVRVPVSWPGTAHLRDGASIDPEVIDVSVGGIQFQTAESFAAESLDRVEFTTTPSAAQFDFRATCCWSTTGGALHYVGVQFVKPPRAEVDRLGAVIRSVHQVRVGRRKSG